MVQGKRNATGVVSGVIDTGSKTRPLALTKRKRMGTLPGVGGNPLIEGCILDNYALCKILSSPGIRITERQDGKFNFPEFAGRIRHCDHIKGIKEHYVLHVLKRGNKGDGAGEDIYKLYVNAHGHEPREPALKEFVARFVYEETTYSLYKD